MTLASLSQTLPLVGPEAVSTPARLLGAESGSCHRSPECLGGAADPQASGFPAPYLTTLQNSIFVFTLDSALRT